jgi:hypothetical protein
VDTPSSASRRKSAASALSADTATQRTLVGSGGRTMPPALGRWGPRRLSPSSSEDPRTASRPPAREHPAEP